MYSHLDPATLNNIAEQKPAVTDVAGEVEPGSLVDGVTSPDGTCSNTDVVGNVTWAVDLQGDYSIRAIRLFTQDCGKRVNAQDNTIPPNQ